MESVFKRKGRRRNAFWHRSVAARFLCMDRILEDLILKCHDIQMMISGFIDDRLSDEQTEMFLDHVEHCQDCYDELEVYYMITAGLRQLDENHEENPDLQKNLRELINNKRQELQNEKRTLLWRRRLRRVTGVCFFAVLFFVLYIFYSSEDGIHTFTEFKRSAITAVEEQWHRLTGRESEDKTDPYERRRNFEQKYPLIPDFFYCPGTKPHEIESGNLYEKDG